jgi:hypothetical protein
MKIKVCPKCEKKQTDPQLLACPQCKELYAERDTDEPPRLSDEQLDEIAKRVAKAFKQDEDSERIANKVVQFFGKDQWKPLAEQILRLLHSHDVETIAKVLIGMWPFWWRLLVILAIAFALIYEVVGHKVESIAKPMLRDELTKQIRLQFKLPTISNTVATVAGNEASAIIKRQVAPAILNFNSVIQSNAQHVATILSNYESTVREAQTNTAELKRLADYYLLVVQAQGGNKSAFWKLDSIAHDGTNPMWPIASQIANQITLQILLQARDIENGLLALPNPSEGNVKSAETATFEEYVAAFSGPFNVLQRYQLLRQFYSQTRFPLRDRLAFLINVLQTYEELLIVNKACLLIDTEAHIDRNFMGTQEYLDWYRHWQQTNAAPTPAIKPPH